MCSMCTLYMLIERENLNKLWSSRKHQKKNKSLMFMSSSGSPLWTSNHTLSVSQYQLSCLLRSSVVWNMKSACMCESSSWQSVSLVRWLQRPVTVIGDDVRRLSRGGRAKLSAAASLTGDDSERLAGRQRQETLAPSCYVTAHFTVSQLPLPSPLSPLTQQTGDFTRGPNQVRDWRQMYRKGFLC